MIEINNINKSFNEKQVLFNISGLFEKGKTPPCRVIILSTLEINQSQKLEPINPAHPVTNIFSLICLFKFIFMIFY